MGLSSDVSASTSLVDEEEEDKADNEESDHRQDGYPLPQLLRQRGAPLVGSEPEKGGCLALGLEPEGRLGRHPAVDGRTDKRRRAAGCGRLIHVV